MRTGDRILVTVKTYPELSKTYGETVCTAGLREDGTWVRLYPVPFRRLEGREDLERIVLATVSRPLSPCPLDGSTFPDHVTRSPTNPPTGCSPRLDGTVTGYCCPG